MPLRLLKKLTAFYGNTLSQVKQDRVDFDVALERKKSVKRFAKKTSAGVSLGYKNCRLSTHASYVG